MMDKQTTTNTQPTTEQKAKMAAKEPQDVNTNSRKQEDKYTRPPRVSFGFELEFLVAMNPRGVKSDDNIPGLAPVTDHICGTEAVLALLKEHRFHARKFGEPSSKGYPWVVSSDGSVTEAGSRVDEPCYEWQSVEISSPPMYSCDEAYRLVSAVVRLLTSKLRIRVNTTCGFHVHVGNGPHQLDMRAARNYAALQWASEQVLSTLHCPTRSFAHWSKSIRRCSGIDLTRGSTAKTALGACVGADYIPRYVGRARKLGEAPVASKAKLRQRVRQAEKPHDVSTYLEPEFESDDSDYECDGSKPFHRPRKIRGMRRELTDVPEENHLGDEAREGELDSESTRRESPPQLDFPIPRSMASISKSSSSDSGGHLLDPKRTKRKVVFSPEHLPWHRYELDCDQQRGPEGYTKSAWGGIAELLACDVGVHQVASLMTEGSTSLDGHKGYTYNWKGQLRGELGVKTRVTHGTVESCLAGGSLDAEWIVIWIKIQCRMLEWARDADPSQLMRVLDNLSRDDLSKECTYDVLDFLKDPGMYTEIKHCEKRLLRAEEAWFECMMLKMYEWIEVKPLNFDKGGSSWNPSFDCEGGEWLDDGETRNYLDWSDLSGEKQEEQKEEKKGKGLYSTEQDIHR